MAKKKKPHHLKTPRLDVTQYRGQWLALHPTNHKVIAHDRLLKNARKKAIEQGISDPIFYAVPKSDAYFVG